MKGLVLFILCFIFFIIYSFILYLFLHNSTRLSQHIESIYYILYWQDFLLFFVFHQIRRIYMWSTTTGIYLMAFMVQYLNIIKDKLTSFHWLKIILISISKWIRKFFHNFTSSILNHNFCVITFWMHYMLFLIIYRRNKIICYY